MGPKARGMNRPLLAICIGVFVLLCVEVKIMRLARECPEPLFIPAVEPRAKPFSDFIGLFWDSDGTFHSRNVVFTYMKYLIPRGWDFHMFVTDRSLAFYRRNGTFAELEDKKRLTFSVIPPFNRDSFAFLFPEGDRAQSYAREHKHTQKTDG